jgi:hypothetical protein
MENTMKKEVEFDAHKTVKKPTTVEFTTRSGKEVDFTAKKNVRVPVSGQTGGTHGGQAVYQRREKGSRDD